MIGCKWLPSAPGAMHQEDDYSQRMASASLTEEEQEQLRIVMERAQVSN